MSMLLFGGAVVALLLAPSASAAAPKVSISSARVVEGNSGIARATLRVRLSVSSRRAVRVRFATSPGNARAGTDFVSARGSVRFRPRQRLKTIRVAVIGDAVVEGAEKFSVTLSRPRGVTLKRRKASVTIVDDDLPPVVDGGPPAPGGGPGPGMGGGGTPPDTTPPAAPSGLATSPASPSSDSTPSVTGTAESGSTVRVYVGGACTGTPSATGTAAEFASPGLTVAVPNDATAQIRAEAVDSSANVSSCSSALSYVEDSVLNESDTAPEADFCNLQSPVSFSAQTGQTSPLVYGRLFEAGLTEAAGPPAGVLAQVGVGPDGTDPWTSGWTWSAAAYNTQVGNDDEYQGSFTVPSPGTYRYGYRFSFDGGEAYTYCDLDGAGSNAGNSFDKTQLGTLTATP